MRGRRSQGPRHSGAAAASPNRSCAIFCCLSSAVACASRPADPPHTQAVAGPDAIALIGEPLAFPTTAATQGTWTFGDGETASATPELTHSYVRAGHFTAVLEVRAEDGWTDRDSRVITVVRPTMDPPPRRSGGLTEGPAGQWYAALPDFDKVARFDLTSGSVTHLEHPACEAPHSVDAGGDSLWVSCEDSDTLVRWTGAVAEPVELLRGDRPAGVLTLDDGTVAVALRGASALLLRSSDGSAQRTPLAQDPHGLALVGDRIYVSHLLSPGGAGLISVLDLQGDLLGTIPLPADPGPDSDTTNRGVPSWLWHLSPAPDGETLLVPGQVANVLRGQFRDGLPLTQETTARAMLRAVDPTGEGVDRLEDGKVFDDRDLALDATFSARGDWIYVAFIGVQRVDVLDRATMDVVGSAAGVGAGLCDLRLASPGTLLALASLDREIVEIDLGGDGAQPTVRARHSLLPPEGEVLDPVVLLGKKLFHDAADPRLSRDGYLSCGSCHLFGEGDRLVWDFTDRGEGLRNTISLIGRAGKAPLHWSANFDEVQDFENDIRGGMGGSGLLSETDWIESRETLGPPKAGRSSDLDALAAYVASLDQPRPVPTQDPAAVSRGEQLFSDAERHCITCHPPPAYTDSAFIDGAPVLHDVGTLGPGSGGRLGGLLSGLDTPSLRGLWHSAPYLHDGSAPDLRAVLVERNGDDAHGRTSDLDAAQIEDLEAFLMSLE